MLPRSSGILLHPTSLFTKYGIGDIGPIAFEFIEFLKNTKQSFWQMLPLGPTGYADSPYQGLSAFAGNPLLISIDKLIKMDLIEENIALKIFEEGNQLYKKWTKKMKIDYERVRKCKYKVFQECFKNFNQSESKYAEFHEKFKAFCDKQAYWLDDYVLFYTLKIDHDLKPWTEWKENYFKRGENAIKVYAAMHKKKLKYYKFIQWLFDEQWKELRKFAHKNGVKIIGDMPIFVAHDSSDVWCNKELFTLKEDGSLKYQAGVPPDYFSKTGQLWGNPLYNWDKLKEDNYIWFIHRIKRLLELVDYIRIDHFRGFEAYWRVKGDAENAIKGKWVEAPGKQLFIEIKNVLGELPIIAENLGVITPKVEQLRKKFGFPGMAVLQFAFSSDYNNPHLPHNYERKTIVYPGTHDNNTIKGFWNNDATKDEKRRLLLYLNLKKNNIGEGMIQELYKSVANCVIVQFQDILGQNEQFRMNTPSESQGNWQYIIDIEKVPQIKKEWLDQMTVLYGRYVNTKNNK